jgi:hypothetical protein
MDCSAIYRLRQRRQSSKAAPPVSRAGAWTGMRTEPAMVQSVMRCRRAAW